MRLLSSRPDRNAIMDHISDILRTDDMLINRVMGIDLVRIPAEDRRPYQIIFTIGMSPTAPYELSLMLDHDWDFNAPDGWGRWPAAMLGTFAKESQEVGPFVSADFPHPCGPYAAVYFVPSPWPACPTKRGPVEFLACLPITPDERDFKIAQICGRELWRLIEAQEPLRDPLVTKMVRDSYLTGLE